MKSLLKIAAMATLALGLTHAAKADTINGSISLGSGGSYSSTGVTFNNSGAANNGSVTVSNGTFASLFVPYGSNMVSINSFNYTDTTPYTFFTVTSGGNVLTFKINSITSHMQDNSGQLYVAGTGTFTLTTPSGGTTYAPATGNFNLSSSGTGQTNIGFTISSAASPTPEPSSLLLMGTGLMSAAGVVFKRRRKTESVEL